MADNCRTGRFQGKNFNFVLKLIHNDPSKGILSWMETHDQELQVEVGGDIGKNNLSEI